MRPGDEMTNASNLPDEVDVLVVGAGPTGLTMAALLAEIGIEALTVDLRSGISEHSKAIGVQARTLELFEKLGITGRMCGLGLRISGAQMYRDGAIVAEIPLSDAGKGQSPYPFVLTLDQSETERLLLSAASQRDADIRWETEVVGLEDVDGGVRATLRQGERETRIHCDWVVGADGASSIVRKATGQLFEGGTYEEAFMLLDADIEGISEHSVVIDLLEDGMMAFFPLPGTTRFRVVGTVPPEIDPDALDRDGLVAFVGNNSSIDIAVGNARWSSTYRLHHRKADDFRVGRMFLAGDAAHVHSPVGGQGMNTGIGDAFNLAWKLGMVVKYGVDERVLDSYPAEREPFARALLDGTDRAFQVIAGRNPVSGLFKRRGLPLVASTLGRILRMRQEIFRRVSQISIGYEDSWLSTGDVRGAIDAGERMPDVEVQDGGTLFEHMRDYRHHAVVVDGDPATLSDALTALPDTPSVTRFERESAETLGLDDGIVLLRPDGHVGAVGSGSDAMDTIREYAAKLYPRRD
jgi:2-polyprenyl-6-methoxyphenol hydroxylase-like FAD-dependent oxidoreductase